MHACTHHHLAYDRATLFPRVLACASLHVLRRACAALNAGPAFESVAATDGTEVAVDWTGDGEATRTNGMVTCMQRARPDADVNFDGEYTIVCGACMHAMYR